MPNWLERARHEIRESDEQGTANTDERNLTAVTAVLTPGESRISEGPITAVLIDSPIVGPVWFALDDGFKSGDDIPVFYASEIPYLQKMSEAELRQRYEQKLALGGGWIRDSVEEP